MNINSIFSNLSGLLVQNYRYFCGKIEEIICHQCVVSNLELAKIRNIQSVPILTMTIKDKTFSGYHILAYYYVSWSLAIPEMVSQLNLPYEAEYKMALTMHKPNK